jgi:hypothetical protein
VSTERFKRPALDRRGPLRSWSTLFGPPPRAPESEGEEAQHARQGGLDDVVTRSVELGYRVIDDWVRQGQSAARHLGDGPAGVAGFGQDVQDLVVRMAQHASDLFGMWVQLFDLTATGGARGTWPPAAWQMAAPQDGHTTVPPAAVRTAPAAAPVTLRIEVASSQPTEVSFDLRHEAAGSPLIAHALRAVDPDAPRLDDVSIVGHGLEEPLVARIRVPDGHPPGIYNGLILDESTNRPVGSLSVRVGSAA